MGVIAARCGGTWEIAFYFAFAAWVVAMMILFLLFTVKPRP